MKKNKIVSGLLVVLLVMLSFSVVAFADEHVKPENVVALAQGVEGEFTILEDALIEAGLVDALTDPEAEFTVFAPTDAAFEKLLGDYGLTAEELLASGELLKNVLLYHVVSGTVMSSDLIDGPVETLLEENIIIDAGNFKVNDSNILVDDKLFDLEADNGVVHVIDQVLLPEEWFEQYDSIVEIAIADENFSILVEALTKAELVSVLEGGPFTVFAPTNDAFAALLEDLDLTKEELLELDNLADILLYHVVPVRAFASDLSDGQTLPTALDSASLTVSISNGTVNINESEVTAANIVASNGVIHVLDAVLIPEEEEEDMDDAWGDIGMLPYIFVGALGVSGLVVMKKRK